MTLAWGILGTGRFADTWIAPAVRSVPGCKLAAVGSRDLATAREFASKHAVDKAYGSYQQVLDDPAVQVVYIGTPNAMHADQVRDCARAGKHVFCDKPLALSTQDAVNAADACRAADVLLGINFQYRQHPAFVAARRLINEGAIGDVVLAQAESGGKFPLRTWRQDSSLAGMGATLNIGVHAYDLLSFLLGQHVADVFAVTNQSDGSPETVSLAVLRMAQGSFAYVNANQVTPLAQPDLVVHGSRGRLAATNCLRLGVDGTLQLDGEKETETWQFDSRDIVARGVAQFTRAITDGELPSAGPEDGIRSVEVAEAISRSARTGCRVSVFRVQSHAKEDSL